MANDVGAILAALATGAPGGGNSSTQKSDGAINRIVGVTLRLIADPGNADAVKELTDQVGGAARKVLQEMDALRKQGTDQSRRMGGVSRPHGERGVATTVVRTHAGNGKDHDEARRDACRKRAVSRNSPWHWARSRNSLFRAAQNSNRAGKKTPEGGRAERFEKGADELVDVGTHLIGLAKRVAVLRRRTKKPLIRGREHLTPLRMSTGRPRTVGKSPKVLGKSSKVSHRRQPWRKRARALPKYSEGRRRR